MSPLKDLAFPVQSAFFSKLAGLMWGATAIPTYDSFVPKDAPDYFIVIKDVYVADDSLKCGHSSDVHVVLDIVTRFNVGYGSSKVVNDISDTVKGLFVPNAIDLNPEFSVLYCSLALDKKIQEETNTDRIIRKILTFKLNIQQLI